MKNSLNLLIGFGTIALFAAFLFSNHYQSSLVATKVVADNCTFKNRCGFIKANGYQCGNYATGNSYYCWSHNR